MSKNTEKKPMRLVTFGNYMWVHWLTVTFFLIAGILITVIPNILSGKAIFGTIIVGIVLIAIGIFCVCDQIVFICRIKKWQQKENNIQK